MICEIRQNQFSPAVSFSALHFVALQQFLSYITPDAKTNFLKLLSELRSTEKCPCDPQLLAKSCVVINAF